MRNYQFTLLATLAAAFALAAPQAWADGGSLSDYIDPIADPPMVADVLAHCPMPAGYPGGADAYRETIESNFAMLHLDGDDRTKAAESVKQYGSREPADHCQIERTLAILGGAPVTTSG